MGESFWVPNQRARHAITTRNERVIVPSNRARLDGRFTMTVGTSGSVRGFNKAAGYGSITQPLGWPEIIQITIPEATDILIFEFANSLLPVDVGPLKFQDDSLGFFRTAQMTEQVGNDRYRAQQPVHERWLAWDADVGNTIGCRIVDGRPDNARLLDRLYQSNTTAIAAQCTFQGNGVIAGAFDLTQPLLSITYPEYIDNDGQPAELEVFVSNISGPIPVVLGDMVYDTWINMVTFKGLAISPPDVALTVSEASIRLASSQEVLVSRALVVLERTVP